jgi:hypothetical protein
VWKDIRGTLAIAPDAYFTTEGNAAILHQQSHSGA